MAKKINDLAGYSRVAKVNKGLIYVKDIDAKIEEYAKLFGYSNVRDQWQSGNIRELLSLDKR
ncbi:MAG: hypothetical protein WB014_00700 [Methanosarcina sp.]